MVLREAAGRAEGGAVNIEFASCRFKYGKICSYRVEISVTFQSWHLQRKQLKKYSIMFVSFSPVKSLILNVIRNEFITVHKRRVDFRKAVIANPDVCWNWKQRDRIRKELPLSIRVSKQTNSAFFIIRCG